ncbi:MAG: glutamine-hydrolyzing carbamoyl-phosphate synthase small subunit [Thermodesulfovibrionales bacterium]|nr:glutamine-hydrolyzing carbamoyl-phosphate synthase small subunit [Thermodesulfovibrionales bacterium]
MKKKAVLVLQDGTVFEGAALGAQGQTIGEVVFNTSMTGYQEILTDPSYKGQIVTMTYTQIGNYGINEEDIESEGGIKAEGFIVKEACPYPSNWRSKTTLDEYLKQQNKVAIQDIDTRALTRLIRIKGAQRGIISSTDLDTQSLYKKVREFPDISTLDLVSDVATGVSYKWQEGLWGYRDVKMTDKKVVVYDFGVKLNILRSLVSVGLNVEVVSPKTPAEAVLEMKPDGILLSNGPGDPKTVLSGIRNTKKLMGKVPIFGICLGHQIIGLALGGETYKLRFGHHGGNHPVMDLHTEEVKITSQNHNYCVDIKSLKGKVRLTHKNLFDGSEEGMEHVEYPLFSVQYHPEAGPGPNDAKYLFERFLKLLQR